MTEAMQNTADEPLVEALSPNRRWQDFSTEIKILLALVIGLAPLGILGVMATVKGNANAERDRAALIRVAGNELTRNLGVELASDRAMVRRSLVGVPVADLFPEEAQRICTDIRFSMTQPEIPPPQIFIVDGRFTRELCPDESKSYFATDRVAQVPIEGLLAIDADNQLLLSSVRFDEQDEPYAAVLAYRPETLAALAGDSEIDLPAHSLTVVGRGGDLPIIDNSRALLAGSTLEIRRPIGQTAHELSITVQQAAISRNELVSLLAPIGNWLLGAVLAWGMLSFFIMRPLSRLHRSVAAYRPGAVFLRPRKRHATAREIVQLEADFSALSETVAADKAELAKSLERQTSLTREIHHRVKNNLQIIASLINLHSRAAPPETEGAYLTIQRRVDALSVVHRNHSADEPATGVAVRPLMAELTASLRSSGERSVGFPAISLAVDPLDITQDVAVSLSFLVTELAELSSVCDPAAEIAVTVEKVDDVGDASGGGSLARLTVQSRGLIAGDAHDGWVAERYGRVITGLSRQLRQAMVYDGETGRYCIVFPVLDVPGEDDAAL